METPTEQIVKHINVKANSFECGKPANRFKLYFEDATDLQAQIDKLKALGFNVDKGSYVEDD